MSGSSDPFLSLPVSGAEGVWRAKQALPWQAAQRHQSPFIQLRQCLSVVNEVLP
jgi:hypothetical protein